MFEQLNSLMVQYHVWFILATICMLAFTVKLVIDGLKEVGLIQPNDAGKWNIALNSVIGVATFLFQFFNQQVLLTDAQGAAEAIAPKITFILVTILGTKAVHELLKWVLGKKDKETPPDAMEKPVFDAISGQALRQGISPGVGVEPMGFAPSTTADMKVVPMQAHQRTGNARPPSLRDRASEIIERIKGKKVA